MIIVVISMIATLIGYSLIIPHSLSVVKHKSDVIKTFADVPISDIYKIINVIKRVSAEDLIYNKIYMDMNFNFELKESSRNHRSKNSSKEILPILLKPLEQESNKMLNNESISINNENIIKNKKEILSNADHSTKVMALLLISSFVFVILVYFGLTIVITVLIFQKYDDLNQHLRWISLRQSVMTLEMFNIREMTILNTTKSDEDSASGLLNLYYYERMIQYVKNSDSSIYENFKSISEGLDSNKFCDIIEDSLGDFKDVCRTFQNRVLLRGMQTNIYQVVSYLNSIENSYAQMKYTNYSFVTLLEISNWQIARKF